MEPNIAPEITAALHSPDAGTLIPYEYTIALAENAADNGVEVRIRRTLDSIGQTKDGPLLARPAPLGAQGVRRELRRRRSRRKPRRPSASVAESVGNYFGGVNEGGPWENFPELLKRQAEGVRRGHEGWRLGSMKAMNGVPVGHETIKAKYIINCAGGASDKVARMVGDESFTIKPRLGEYVLLKKSSGSACNHILFPCPGKYGKGILVQKTSLGQPDPRPDRARCAEDAVGQPHPRPGAEWPNKDPEHEGGGAPQDPLRVPPPRARV